MSHRSVSILVCLLTLILWGCAPATRTIAVPTSAPVAASTEGATVVIYNRFGWLGNVLDERGTVVAQLKAKSFTAIQIPAGHTKLYLAVENKGVWGDRVEGTVEAGKLYHLWIGMRYGGAALTVLSPRTNPESFAGRKEWQTKLEQVALDPQGLAGLQQDLGDVTKLLADIENAYAKHDDPEDIPNRTITPQDAAAF